MDLPADLESLGRSPEYDRTTVPAALLERHALGERSWARLTVLEGRVRFVDLHNDRRTDVEAGDEAVVPPELPHRVELDDGTRFQLEFFRASE